jgi:hypothetical protein
VISDTPRDLSPAETARAIRFKESYWVGAHFQIECLREAEALADRLRWQRWLYQRGKVAP